ANNHPAATRNPHDPSHTPGGSSSGSAAAVADFMTPAALGTQTGGSVIRPAAYCGVAACKPSFGSINRAGLKFVAESLDTIGVVFLLTPSAAGEAPASLASTGDPVFNRAWTLFGVPCVTLPFGRGPGGLPLGIQMVGAFDADMALLAWAHWAERALG